MTNIVKYSVNGKSYDFESPAAKELQDFEDHLRSTHQNAPNGEEILKDFFARMAELLDASLNAGKTVVSEADVKNLVARLNDNSETPFKAKKPLYRKTSNAVLGGVCSGLATYFDIDTNLIRLLTATLGVLAGGFAIPAYLVMWFVLPTESNYQNVDQSKVWRNLIIGLILAFVVIPIAIAILLLMFFTVTSVVTTSVGPVTDIITY